MRKPFTYPNFHFKPKEAFNENKTVPSKSVKYDSIISSILTQASPTQTQSYRILLSKENQMQFKRFISHEKKKKVLPLNQTNNNISKKKREIIASIQQKVINSNSKNNKNNGSSKEISIKTESLYKMNKQISKSGVKIDKQKSVVSLKPKEFLKSRVLLLSPEKTLLITGKNKSFDLFGITPQLKHIRKRNPYSLSKEREKRNLENRLLFAERENCIEEINHKINSLYFTQDGLKIYKAHNQEDNEDLQNINNITEVKASILNLIRAKRKKRNNRKINTVN